MNGRFQDRQDAGRQLASHLMGYANQPDVLVLALPRGGVPVAHEVARELDAPLDIFLVRKLGVPGQEELAMGAIASGGVRVVNRQVVQMLGLTEAEIAAVAADERQELERRDREYRGNRAPPEIEGKTVILVDDGLATGSTMRAAAAAVRAQDPERLVVAVPVGAPDTCDAMRGEVDEVVCAITPEPFYGVGAWYANFAQTTDEEVREILGRSSRSGSAHNQSRGGSGHAAHQPQASDPEQAVRVRAGRVQLQGNLTVPADARGVVLFAHGSGSGRHSPRNRFVARELNEAGLATLLIDLLTMEEERIDVRTRHLRFDIGLLAERLVDATDWLRGQPDTRELPVGYFGASTGGGAALVAAAQRPDAVGAVVSRGGRPDLAGDALPHVRAPTLLIVGGDDVPVIGMNEDAMARMSRAEVKLEIVPGATHLFEEPGKLEEVAGLARDWFKRYLEPAMAGRLNSTASTDRHSRPGSGPGYGRSRRGERGRYESHRGYVTEARNRPGRRVRAAEIMTENPEVVTPDDTIDLAARKMRDLDVGILPVVNDPERRRLVGVVTDRDLAVRALAEGKGGKTRVRTCMSDEVSTVREDSSVRDLLSTMRTEQVRRVPVVDHENRLVGIVAQADLAVEYAEGDLWRERNVESAIERISEPARPRRGRGGYGRPMEPGRNRR